MGYEQKASISGYIAKWLISSYKLFSTTSITVLAVHEESIFLAKRKENYCLYFSSFTNTCANVFGSCAVQNTPSLGGR